MRLTGIELIDDIIIDYCLPDWKDQHYEMFELCLAQLICGEYPEFRQNIKTEIIRYTSGPGPFISKENQDLHWDENNPRPIFRKMRNMGDRTYLEKYRSLSIYERDRYLNGEYHKKVCLINNVGLIVSIRCVTITSSIFPRGRSHVWEIPRIMTEYESWRLVGNFQSYEDEMYYVEHLPRRVQPENRFEYEILYSYLE